MPIDLTRSILVILIPGAVACSPFFLYSLSNHRPVWNLYESFPLAIQVIFFSISVIFGLFFEIASSYMERSFDNYVRDCRKDLELDRNWNLYLARPVASEPVGYRYLSRKVTMLYFDLCMAQAIPFALVGYSFLWWGDVHILVFPALFFACVILICWIYLDAKTTHELLCKTRRDINLVLQEFSEKDQAKKHSDKSVS